MKRYGHKNTGLVYIEGTDNLYYWRNNGKFDQSIPKEIIENSNDWQLLSPKFLFKTIDGVDIYEGDEFFYTNTLWNLESKVYSSKDIPHNNPVNHDWINKYSTYEKADRALIDNIRALSLSEIRQVIRETNRIEILEILLESLTRSKIKLPKR